MIFKKLYRLGNHSNQQSDFVLLLMIFRSNTTDDKLATKTKHNKISHFK